MKKHNSSIDEWNIEFPNTAVEDLIQHGKDIVQHALNYYICTFNQEEGDIYRLKRAATSCQVFNPFVLKEWNLASLEILIDNLVYFEYRHFTEKFISKMKKEIPIAIEHTNHYNDWESTKPTTHYETRLDKRRKRRKLKNNHQFDWKNDPGEKASRIFEYQKVKCVVDKD